jgi:hypothetical protein
MPARGTEPWPADDRVHPAIACFAYAGREAAGSVAVGAVAGALALSGAWKIPLAIFRWYGETGEIRRTVAAAGGATPRRRCSRTSLPNPIVLIANGAALRPPKSRILRGRPDGVRKKTVASHAPIDAVSMLDVVMSADAGWPVMLDFQLSC